jgi:hypothetical protein
VIDQLANKGNLLACIAFLSSLGGDQQRELLAHRERRAGASEELSRRARSGSLERLGGWRKLPILGESLRLLECVPAVKARAFGADNFSCGSDFVHKIKGQNF